MRLPVEHTAPGVSLDPNPCSSARIPASAVVLRSKPDRAAVLTAARAKANSTGGRQILPDRVGPFGCRRREVLQLFPGTPRRLGGRLALAPDC